MLHFFHLFIFLPCIYLFLYLCSTCYFILNTTWRCPWKDNKSLLYLYVLPRSFSFVMNHSLSSFKRDTSSFMLLLCCENMPLITCYWHLFCKWSVHLRVFWSHLYFISYFFSSSVLLFLFFANVSIFCSLFCQLSSFHQLFIFCVSWPVSPTK